MKNILLKYLSYLGPGVSPAGISFYPGLNVICGSSETGKSLIVESIDFMFGQRNPVRDIPERKGYDRIRLEINSTNFPSLTLERSVEGGDFSAYEESVSGKKHPTEPKTLRWQHSASRKDTLSYALLERTGLLSKTLRKNADGKTRSLSFRDLARLCIVNDEEIDKQGSPLITGQYVTATAEYSTFKLLITGVDDSALVSAQDISVNRDFESGKIELLEQMIDELQAELNDEGADESEFEAQLNRIEARIKEQKCGASKYSESFEFFI